MLCGSHTGWQNYKPFSPFKGILLDIRLNMKRDKNHEVSVALSDIQKMGTLPNNIFRVRKLRLFTLMKIKKLKQ